ncbi:PREDICTED: prostaglandin F synthase 1 isoform X2 [Capra hircus]|uniref:prostaglandin F synthase 1 isoform X2 n=1 Tax=Capra hircus TaxID=9925 RepID=UPI000846D6D8|nr:PREDICTED: prostaglandin F synthase 1 isoform X2 [Capra hircus]
MNQVKLFSLKMNDGYFMPLLGLGTSASKVVKSEVEKAVMRAIDVGYHHIDSAYIYQNEEEIGRAIQMKLADGTVKRGDLFLTTKLWNTLFHLESVQTCLESSLRKLQLSYVDLYLIHSPTALKPGEDPIPEDTHGNITFDTVDLCITWEALEKCKDAGLTKSIGVSNFNHKQLEKILNKPGLKYKPVCNQVIPSLICPHSLLPPHQLTLPSFQQSHQMALPSFPVTSGHQLIQQNSGMSPLPQPEQTTRVLRVQGHSPHCLRSLGV